MRKCVVLLSAMLLCNFSVQASPNLIYITDVRVFTGKELNLTPPLTVEIAGNTIKQLHREPVTATPGATVINAAGHILIPGLIDAHAHLAFAATPLLAGLTGDVGFVHHLAGREASAMLQRGFTTVRDVGGPVFGLKQAIDSGVLNGPRIFPSGALISQTGGHGDFRLPTGIPHDTGLSHSERIGAAAIADGKAAVLKRSREQLMLGASQLKLMAGGGVSSFYDPLDVAQYTEEEMQAAVQAAENWGTYVTVHAYTPRAMQMAIRAGVKSIEHGQLADEATVRLMAKEGVWWSLQPFLDDEYANPQQGEARQKQLRVSNGTDRAYNLAKKHKVQIAWGTDMLFSPGKTANQNAQLVKMQRWFSPAEILKMATYDNGRLLALSGERAPYQGKLGVIEPGALADVLLVKGNPLAQLELLADPAQNLLLIIKDGKIYKNTLADTP
ncbi:hydrolase [Arsukibacterium ikkense]|uniref:Hydrolase n=1 Tax=Arsukibacterium ikkense TaxID=336831 RepID=A0A0M2V1U2_9GAMM|nr:amidohydrolase family protein [Arsukibacterium ikkense]KKO44344.1 hydrolase [Arsukibacterium ikkense]